MGTTLASGPSPGHQDGGLVLRDRQEELANRFVEAQALLVRRQRCGKRYIGEDGTHLGYELDKGWCARHKFALQTLRVAALGVLPKRLGPGPIGW